MRCRPVAWFAAGVSIAIAAAIVGSVIVAVRHRANEIVEVPEAVTANPSRAEAGLRSVF